MTIISHYIMVTVYLFGVIIIYLMVSMLSTDVSIMGHCLIACALSKGALLSTGCFAVKGRWMRQLL